MKNILLVSISLSFNSCAVYYHESRIGDKTEVIAYGGIMADEAKLMDGSTVQADSNGLLATAVKAAIFIGKIMLDK